MIQSKCLLAAVGGGRLTQKLPWRTKSSYKEVFEIGLYQNDMSILLKKILYDVSKVPMSLNGRELTIMSSLRSF